MWKFIVRRVCLALMIIVCGGFIIYGVMRSMPTSYVEKLARERAAATATTGGASYQEWLEKLTEAYHMNDGVVKGYVNWLGNVVRGDFGDSWFYGVPVTQKFGDVIWYSVILNIITIFLEIIICIPLGIQAACNQYGKFDYGIMIFAMLCISLPTFFLATVLKYIFAIKLNWFDLYGIVGRYYDQLSGWGKCLDMAKHMFLPVLTLCMLNIGSLTRYTRTNMLEVLNADYIRTARAKGVRSAKVIFKHALKNAMGPVVTYAGPMLAYILTGSMVVENIFSVPGLGRLFVNSMLRTDYMMIMGVTIVLATMIVLMNFLADIVYKLLDPRIDLS